MSRLASEKCRLGSKLSPVQAQQVHGAVGDGCWEAKRCHDRRSYYLDTLRTLGRRFLPQRVLSSTAS